MRVYVATYHHKYGEDTRIFKTEEGAEAWKNAIGAEYWRDWHGEKPEKDIGHAYFSREAESLCAEFFTEAWADVED